jgi:hypothetical protein
MSTGKFTKFGITIHPKGGEEVSWKQLTKQEIAAKLRELEYIRPSELARVLYETKIFKESKSNKSTGERIDYYSEVSNFGGQLELGDRNSTPHYQCWIELTSKQPISKVLGYYSRAIYSESRSNAVSVKILTEDIESYVDYCMKEKRADLPDEYQHINIDKMIGMYDKYLEENPDAKKSLIALMAIRDISHSYLRKSDAHGK